MYLKAQSLCLLHTLSRAATTVDEKRHPCYQLKTSVRHTGLHSVLCQLKMSGTGKTRGPRNRDGQCFLREEGCQPKRTPIQQLLTDPFHQVKGFFICSRGDLCFPTTVAGTRPWLSSVQHCQSYSSDRQGSKEKSRGH